FSRYEIEALKDTFGAGFSAGVLVREPLPRLMSQLAHYQTFTNRHLMDVSYIDPIIADARLVLPDDDPDTKLFVHAVNMLNSIVDENGVGTIYKMEEVTRDPDVFCGLVEHVSGRRIEPDREWVAAT